MLQKPLNQSKSRLAWLTPVQQSSIGRWQLCDTKERTTTTSGHDHTLISVNALLQLLDAAFNTHKKLLGDPNSRLVTIKSDCGSYEASYIREERDASRLFVQNRDDCLARMELYVNKKQIVAYQEPVWPHLQSPHCSTTTRLSIPNGFIDMLETTAIVETRPSGETSKVHSEDLPASNTIAA